MSRRRLWILRAAAGFAAGTGYGCASYEPRPLDPEAHALAWRSRDPAAEGVAELAARLAASDGEPARVFDPSDGLSLPEAEAVAVVFNAELRVARHRAGVAAADAANAGRWEDPVLGIDGERIIERVEYPWLIGAMVSLTIPISGRLGAEKDLARSEHAAELGRIVAEEWRVRIELRRAWLNWSAERLRAEQAEMLLSELESIVTSAERLERAGELARTESRLLALERAALAAQAGQLEAALRESTLALHHMMGLTPNAPVVLVPAPLAWRAADGENDSELLESTLAARNPSLAVQRREYDVAEQSLHLEIRKQYPDIEIGGGYGEEDNEGRVLFGLSLPIPLWNQNRLGVAVATAERDLARAIYEASYESMVWELESARARFDAAAALRASIETDIVPLVDEQDRDMRRLVELGEVDALLLLESVTSRYDARIDLIDARLAESLAAVEIGSLLGPPALPDLPAPQPSPDPSELPAPPDAARHEGVEP